MKKKYYYDQDGTKDGPFTAQELQQLLFDGTITADSWIRSENSTTWRKLEDVSFDDEQEEPAPSTRRSAALAMLGSLSWKAKLALAILFLILLPILLLIGIVSLIVRFLRKI